MNNRVGMVSRVKYNVSKLTRVIHLTPENTISKIMNIVSSQEIFAIKRHNGEKI